MYEAFYGLNEKPFNLTPDPRFLYLSTKHEEAFAHLLYGIQNRSGFVMVSGEIGTGKTTICRSLLRTLDAETEVAYIFNPKLSPEELLRTINEDFAIPTVAGTMRGLVDELNKYLLKRTAEGKNCVLIIDEAQNLEPETLEQIRLLSNLETETEKLLQIVLIGQPELPEKLKLPELRQLDQRITARYHLTTLNRSETLRYIAFRLQVAGGRKRVRFTRGAVRLVYRISQGTPRIINAICDRALLIGYTKETRQITPSIIRQAAREVRGDSWNRDMGFRPRRLVRTSVVVAIGVVLLVAALLTSGPLRAISDAGSFARSQWERVVAMVDDVTSRENSSLAAADADGPDGLEGDAASPGVVDVEQVLEDRVDVAASAVEVTPKEVKPPSLKTAEAASRAAAVEGPSEEDPSDSPSPDMKPVLREARARDIAAEAAAPSPEVIEEKVPRSVRDAMRGPLSAILSAWDLGAPSASPLLDSIEDVRGYALANDLSFAGRPISLGQAVEINLPFLALVRRGLEEDWLAVLAIENGVVRVSSGADEAEDLAIEEFRSIFLGEVAYIWLDSQAGATPLRARAGGKDVLELQDGLRTLGLLDREPTGVYDAPTIEVVSKIQRATGLRVDGIFGPQTRMVLGNWLEERPVRVLAKPVFSEAARDRVLSSDGMVPAAEAVASSLSVPEDPVASKGGPVRSEGVTILQELEPADESSTGPTTGRASDVPDDGDEVSVPETTRGPRRREAGSIVSMEGLGRPVYRPQLEFGPASLEDGVTPSAGPNVPIVPSDFPRGER